MKKFLCVGEQYDQNGQTKTSWKRIGEIFTAKSGKEYAKIYHMPGALLSVFEDKPNDSAKPAKPAQPATDEFGADMDINF